MKFQEPKIEFVPIDLTIITEGSTCDQETSKRGSIETCTGDDADSNNCVDASFFS